MTTIAYRSGVMASDSAWSYDGLVDSLQNKVVRLSSGGLLGTAGDGDSRELIPLVDKVRTAAGLPARPQLLQLRLDCLGILVLPRGRIFKIQTTHVSEANWDAELDAGVGLWEISHDFAAIGSGWKIAMGAMGAGKGAVDAVRIACRFDNQSRPPIYNHVLKKAHAAAG